MNTSETWARVNLQATDATVVNISATDFTLIENWVNVPFLLYVWVTGNVKVDMHGTWTGITFIAMAVGYQPILVTKVYKTWTDASSLLALK